MGASFLPFSSPYETGAFSAACLAWLLFEVRDELRSKRGPKVKIEADRGTVMTNYAAVGLAVAISSFLSLARIGRLASSPASFSLGLCLMIGGMALREWAVISLGPYFSPKVELRVGHSLVERGPYRLIRHPAYTGLLMTMLGYSLSVLEPLGALVSAVLFAIAFGGRIRVEEKALEQELGRAYVEYEKRTKRLIPYLVRRCNSSSHAEAIEPLSCRSGRLSPLFFKAREKKHRAKGPKTAHDDRSTIFQRNAVGF